MIAMNPIDLRIVLALFVLLALVLIVSRSER